MAADSRADKAWAKVTGEHLATFCVVAEHGSVSRAAETLGLSQPAVSRQLRIVENAYGVPLYERAGAGIALTDAGALLLPYACEVHDAIARARSFLGGDLAPPKASMRIGLSHHLTSRLTGSLLRAAKDLAAAGVLVDLHLEEAYSRDLLASVEEGRLDAAYVLRADPLTRDGTVLRLVGTDAIVLLVLPDDPLARGGRIRLRHVAGETLIVPSSSSDVFRRIRETILGAALAPGRMLEVSGPAAVRGAVLDGLGIGVTLASFVEPDVRSGGVVAIDPDDRGLDVDIFEATRREDRMFPWQRRALAALRWQVDAAMRRSPLDGPAPSGPDGPTS